MTRLPGSIISAAGAIALLLLAPSTAAPLQLCSPCDIRLAKRAELSSAAAPVTPSMAVHVSRFASGEYVVSHLFVPPAVVRYTANGRHVDVYERRGAGPGEFEGSPYLYSRAGDTLYAFDRNRLLVFDESLRHMRTVRLPLRPRSQAVILRNGGFVLDDRVETDGGRQLLVHVLDSAGELLRSLEPAPPAEGLFLLAASANDGFWTTGRNDNAELRQYTADGRLARRLSVVRPWFSAEQSRARSERDPPPPTNAFLRELDPGTMVFGSWTPGRTWRHLAPEEAVRFADRDNSGLFDTVIDVIDLGNGRTLASARTPHALWPVPGTTQEYYSVRRDAWGHVIVDIWELSLHQRPGR